MPTSKWYWGLTASLGAALLYLGFSQLGSSHRQLAGATRITTALRREGTAAGQPESVAAADAKGAPLHDAMLREALLALNARQPTPAADVSPLAAARATLDARLTNTGANPGATARLEQAVRPLLTPRTLGEATAELSCNPTLCRISVFAEDDARAAQAANALAENMPKAFAGSVAYPDGAGHKAVYLATQASDLNVSPPPEKVAEAMQ
jgi:hypothetical protein